MSSNLFKKQKPVHVRVADMIAPPKPKSHKKQYIGVGLVSAAALTVAGVVANKDRGPS